MTKTKPVWAIRIGTGKEIRYRVYPNWGRDLVKSIKRDFPKEDKPRLVRVRLVEVHDSQEGKAIE